MNEQAEANCPSCGMAVANGSKPTTRDGTTFCCEGCSNGGACTCDQHDHAGESSATR